MLDWTKPLKFADEEVNKDREILAVFDNNVYVNPYSQYKTKAIVVRHKDGHIGCVFDYKLDGYRYGYDATNSNTNIINVPIKKYINVWAFKDTLDRPFATIYASEEEAFKKVRIDDYRVIYYLIAHEVEI